MVGRPKLKCDLCDFRAKSKSGLTQHIRRIHEKPIKVVEKFKQKPTEVSTEQPTPTEKTTEKIEIEDTEKIQPIEIPEISIEEPPVVEKQISIEVPSEIPEEKPEIPPKVEAPPVIEYEYEPEAWADFYEGMYEIAATPMRKFGIDYPTLSVDTKKRVGEAIFRLYKRHPTWFKTWMLDVTDGFIILSPLVLPIIAFIAQKFGGKGGKK